MFKNGNSFPKIMLLALVIFVVSAVQPSPFLAQGGGPRIVWESPISSQLKGTIYDTVITAGTARVVASAVGQVLQIDEKGTFVTLFRLDDREVAIVAEEGKHAGILKFELNSVAAFRVAGLDGKVVVEAKNPDPLASFYRLAARADTFVSLRRRDHAGLSEIAYRFFDSSGLSKSQEIISPASQPPVDSAYAPDGAAFLINQRDGLFSYDPATVKLRWKIQKLVRHFAVSNGTIGYAIVSLDGGHEARKISELYKAGNLIWSFTLKENVRNVAISPASEFVLGSDAQRVHAFKPTSGQPVWSFTVPDGFTINSVAVNDRGFAAIGAQHSSLTNGIVLVFDAAGKQVFRKDLQYHESNAFTPTVSFDAIGKSLLIRTEETLALVAVE